MTSRHYVALTVVATVLGLLAVCGVNVMLDPYNVLRDRGPARVWRSERFSKGQLSLRHVPANYDYVIVGPSLSANIDPENLWPHRVYNLSIDGANIRELSWPLQNVLEAGHLKGIILCVDPFLTKDAASNEGYLAEKDRWAILGSLAYFEDYLHMLKLRFGLSRKPDRFARSENGLNDSNVSKKDLDSRAETEKYLARGAGRYAVDEEAMVALSRVLDDIAARGVPVIAFFYPRPWKVYDRYRGHFDDYKERVSALLAPGTLLLDWNCDAFGSFTKDYTNYSDAGHLSDHGSAIIGRRLRETLDSGGLTGELIFRTTSRLSGESVASTRRGGL